MNLCYANNLISQKTENLILLGKDINQIFQVCKIKKYNNSKNNLFKQETSIIPNANQIFSREINLFYQGAQRKLKNQIQNVNKSSKSKKQQTKNNKYDVKDENTKMFQKNKASGEILDKKSKNQKRISLIRPIFAEEYQETKNNFKNNENKFNPININIQNNIKANSIYNNYIFTDFQKNPVSINNNFKFSFNNFIKIPFTPFEFMPFPNNEDFFRSKELKLKFNSNNSYISNLSGLNNDISKKKDKFSVSLANLSSKETTSEKNKFILIGGTKRKGRKSKKLQNLNLPSKHTKFSSDNMMRKIKNKIIESSRLLVNKVLADEIKNLKNLYQFPFTEFKKIKGSFSQELNIKFNLWFYQIKIKEIFSMEISTKYSSLEKASNKELIEYIFSKTNINYFPKSQVLLNMPFHQYYHDIFLGERKEWTNYFDIKPEENKFDINYLLKSLEDEDKNNNLNKIYIEKINKLAQDYEAFFLYKKMRNVDLGNKKNDFIKSFMNNTFEKDYLEYLEQVKKIKNFYDKRKNGENAFDLSDLNKTSNFLIIPNKTKTEEKQNNIQKEDIVNKIIFNVGEERNKFLEKKRNPYKLQNIN